MDDTTIPSLIAASYFTPFKVNSIFESVLVMDDAEISEIDAIDEILKDRGLDKDYI